MSLIMLKTSLKQKINTVAIFNAIGLGLLWLYTAIYPSLKSQSAQYNKLVKAISPAVLKAFGASGSSVNSLANFLATKQFGFTWLILIILVSVALATSMVSGEIEHKTVGMWLAQPVSRLSIYWSKFIAGSLWVVLSAFITTLGVIPLAALYHSSISVKDACFLAIIGSLFALVVFSLAMLVSSFFSKQHQSYIPLGIILTAMFSLNVVAALNVHLQNLQYVSFFYYFNATDLLNNGVVNHVSLIVFPACIIVFGLLGSWIFKRRDYII